MVGEKGHGKLRPGSQSTQGRAKKAKFIWLAVETAARQYWPNQNPAGEAVGEYTRAM